MGIAVSIVGCLVFFVVLLGVSIFFMLRVPPRYTIDPDKKEETDHRVIHFTLRLALTLGIGAVIIGILIVAALLGLQFWE